MNCGAIGAQAIRPFYVAIKNCRCGTKPWVGLEYWYDEDLEMIAIRCPNCYQNICGHPDGVRLSDVVTLWNRWATYKIAELGWF